MSNGYVRMQNLVQYSLFIAGPLVMLSSVIFFYFYFVIPYRQAELLTSVGGGTGARALRSMTLRHVHDSTELYEKKLRQTTIRPDEVKDVFSPSRAPSAE